MLVQFAPLPSHCRQRRAVVSASVHEPALAVRVWPTIGEPLMVGSVLLAGKRGRITPVVSDALSLPQSLVAVTVKRNGEATSPWTTVYVVLVSPPRFEQLLPLLSQRAHW